MNENKLSDEEKIRLYPSLIGRIQRLLDLIWSKNGEIRLLKRKVLRLERRLEYIIKKKNYKNPTMNFDILSWKGHKDNNVTRYKK